MLPRLLATLFHLGGFMKNKLRINKKWVILQGLAGVMEQGFSILILYFIAGMTDDVVSGNIDSFIEKMILVFPVLLMQMIFLYAENLFCVKCKTECGFSYREWIYSSVLNMTNQNEMNKASVLNVYNSQIEQLQEYVAKIADIGISIVTFIIAVFFMIRINFSLLFLSVILMPLSGYFYQMLNKPIQRKNKDILKAKEKINFDMKQMIDGFSIMKAYLFEEKILKLVSSDIRYLKNQEKEIDRMNVILGRISIFLRYIPQLVVPLYGGWLCFSGKLSLGELIVAKQVIYYVILPVESLLDIYKSRKLIQSILEEIKGITDRSMSDKAHIYDKTDRMNGTEVFDKAKDVTVERKANSYLVEMQNISFSYLDGKTILKNTELHILRGMHVALVGESGCGKSTIAKILCGFETEFVGSVKLNGVLIQYGASSSLKENILYLREHITYVPQEPYIYSGTIRENICMGKEILEERFWEIVQLAELTEVVQAFPDGIHTMIGKAGVTLSGGQRKRIAMARALADDVPLFIFDEPLSALDEETGQKIQRNLSKALKGKTVIVITHQSLEFWDGMDEIYRLEGGMITNATAIIS